jgi:hypothetical protein
MISLTIDSTVLDRLKLAMPKTDKAERALEKCKLVLEQMLEHSLLNMEDNLFRHYKHFYFSTHDFDLAVGQFVINGKTQYLTKWLEKNGLSLIHVSKVGLKGQSHSEVKLSKFVTMNDAMDLTSLKKLKIHELDALLNDKSLSDIDFFNRIFPNLLTSTKAQVQRDYDFCPIDTKSVKQFIVWLTHRANKINQVERQMMARQAQVILRIAESGDGTLPMKKKHSHFGRTYYEGISVQSVHRTLREAMLGNCYQYDIRISVISWKMGFAQLLYNSLKNPRPFDVEFGASLAYFEDKKNFREYIKQQTFGTGNHISDEQQMDLVKQALTALGFGARIYQHGWVDRSGKSFNPAIVKIFRNTEDRKRFISCSLIQQFREEQKKLDEFIYELYTSQHSSILTDKELQTEKGKKSTAKMMAYLYQHTETLVMDVVRDELKKLGREVIASVHDAIFIRHRLSGYDRENIQYKMRDISGIEYWVLEQDKHEAYKGVSQEVLRDELAHKKFMAEQEQLASGYKSQFSAT